MGARILVIEDTAENMDLFVYLIQAAGHTPIPARDGVTGLRAVREQRPDLIVSDVRLPDIDGRDLARQLKADPALRGIPLVAVTSHAMVGDRDNVLAAGFDEYISKPIDPPTFVRQLERLMVDVEPIAAGTDERAAASRILIVDDRAVNRQFLITLLGYFGYDIIEASEGEQALDAARARRPDLVIADILMPGMDGFELVRQMRADPALASIPVIFYSATYQIKDARVQAESCGVSHVIGKPSEPEEILATVAKALGTAPPAAIVAPTNWPPSTPDDFTETFLRTVESLETTSLRLSAVIELSLNLAAEPDPDRLLDTFCRAALSIIGARRAAVVLTDSGGGALSHFSSCGFDLATEAKLRAAAERGDLLRDVPAGRHGVLRSNPGGDPRALGLPAAYPPVFAFLAVPLHVTGRTLGWVHFADKTGRKSAFDDEDRRLALTLAALAAVAYENQYLYREVSGHAGKLRVEVADRRAAEEEARVREQQLSGLAANLPGIVFRRVLSPDGSLSCPYLGGQTQEILGYSADELVRDQSLLTNTIAPELRKPYRRAILESARDLSRMEFEHRIIARDGSEKWGLSIATPRRMLDGSTIWDGIGLDMTAQRRSAKERRELEDQLRQSQKLAAVGTLTGGMAHDFNNLLLVILANTGLLADRFAGDGEALGMATAAAEAAERGAELIRLLLAFARRQPLQPARFDAGARVRSVMRLMDRTLGEQVEIAVRLAPDLWPAYADGTLVEAAVANLATNARDAMPGGGRLTVVLRNAVLDADYVASHLGLNPGDYVLIEVSDTGTGMSAEVQSRVFEPFFTTKEVGKGTGLGLSMVYGFALQSGGHLAINSEEGVGTTVRLYVPRARDDAPAAGVLAPARPTPRGDETILVVDDKKSVLDTIARLLDGLGYHTVLAAAPAEALALLASRPGIDLLLTDVVMPGAMSGPDLAREAVARRPGLKVLYSSGFPDTALTGGLPPGSRLLFKPYRRDELARKIREVLDGGI